jgi:REP element-mobilizing transposase RayT
LALLTESHLACHTYPESNLATFNLYCCRARPEWNWEENFRALFNAQNVKIQKIERGESNAAVPAVVVRASRSNTVISQPKFREVKIRERRLPHLERENGIYFVTFRLADSVPQKVLNQIKAEREQAERVEDGNERLSKNALRRISDVFSEKVEDYLDSGFGGCYLQNPEIAELTANSIKFFEGKKYRLFAWCIMPNHVHAVLQPFTNNSLSEILHSWKSFTAKEANRILEREGAFWQRESYDHLIRDSKDLTRIVQYVVENPSKAGLKSWRWVFPQRAVSAGRTHDNRQDDGATFAVGGDAR